MVKAMHAAGIEVILDVVYNHTAEGNHLGPTLSFKGIDNAAYYRLVEDDQRYYMDYTGTGNSLNVRHPHSVQLIMDSLRYWVTEMHVDGFRFDLAATLAREFYDVDKLSTFFEMVQQDPVVSQVKLIAEPWDIGPGGYQVGGFPPQWTEWNGDYRDTVRDFWRGEPSLGDFASRLSGSSDLYEHSGRRPVRQHQLRHRPRRLHAARPRVLQREAQRRQRRGQQRRREPQPLVEPRRGGPDRRRRDPRGAGPRAAQLHRDAAAQPGRADAAARRRDEPHPGRQQQHLRPGQRDQLGPLGPAPTSRSSSSPPPSPSCAPSTRPSTASASSPAAPSAPATASASTTSSGSASTAQPMEDGDWERRQGHRDVPQRRRHRRQGRPRQDDHRRPLPALLQRRRPDAGDAAVGGVRPGVGRRHRHRRQRRRRPDARGRRDVRPHHPHPRRAAPARRAEASPDHSVAASLAARSGTEPRDRPRWHASRRAPTGSRSRPTSTCTPPRAGWPTSTTSAWTGSTSRRCWPPSPAASTATTWSPSTTSTPSAAARRGSRRCPPRPAGSGWACWSTSCPTTSASPPRRRTRGGGTCCGWAASPSTRAPSTSTGRPATAAS